MPELRDIKYRCQKHVDFVMEDPKLKDEAMAIHKLEVKLIEKIEKDLNFNDQGLDMWTLSMDNNKFKENVHEAEGVDK